MKMKYYVLMATLMFVAVIGLNVNLIKQTDYKINGIGLKNIEALAGEGGWSDPTTCYSTYTHCTFWNCSTIYFCNGTQCSTVNCDSKSNQSYCYK